MTIVATHRLPGLVVTDHEFSVPLDHARPDGERISVFAREVVAPRSGPQLPWLVFLQGGPGGKSPRPTRRGDWLARACRDFRVLLLDQRGTGRSTPANRQSLALRGTPAQQADYLALFRADAIVADAELIRAELAGPETAWTALGQSYGGFCTFSYLSFAPQGLAGALVTGGVPSLHAQPDEVYRRTYAGMERANARYYRRYPGDVDRVRAVMTHLAEHETTLPTGVRLTPQNLQTVGRVFGMGDGFDRVHYLFDEAFVPGAGGMELSDTFLAEVAAVVSFAEGPLYYLLHEACYAQGPAPTAWAAQRVRAAFPAFDALRTDGPVLFTGEMVYPWMAAEDPSLQPLAEVAELLAARPDWPLLYDADRLAGNEVPVAAAVYADDLYVERELSLATVDAVPNVRAWVTNEYEHDGIRVSDERVVGRLLDMLHGEV